ncbi:ATP-binding protein [Streptomyces sp. 8N706]|uniref:ATP-binding protein n=1 Tax=Streptomyces sp. 8N706 TaxID=3457416 RepID=UPI003FD5A3EC
MNDDIQLPCFHEAFFRRERRSVPAAREFTTRVLSDWRLTARRDDVLLCVSELATNALLHGVPPGRGYRLQLALDYVGLLRVEVHDSGPGLARVRETTARDEDEYGRGLALVSALADKWGVDERNPGKIVWCEWSLS